jgi:hypothetical protein
MSDVWKFLEDEENQVLENRQSEADSTEQSRDEHLKADVLSVQEYVLS